MESTERRVRMRGARSGPGSQAVYWRDTGELVVEWYDHGETVPYESANMLVFGRSDQRRLASSLGLDANDGLEQLAALLAEKFDSYFEVHAYLDEQALPYQHEVDFEP